MQVDTLHAAGHSAQIPSRIGSANSSVLSATQPDGSALLPTIEQQETADSVLEAAKLETLTTDGFDKEHELQYGPRRTLLLFLALILVGFGWWSLCRWRGSRRKERYRTLKGKGRAVPSSRSKKGKNRNGIRLEDDVEEGSRQSYDEPVRTKDSPRKKSVVFDLGDEVEKGSVTGPGAIFTVEEEDEGEETGEDSDQGDMGRSENPWKV